MSSKKDYVAIATILQQARNNLTADDHVACVSLKHITQSIADHFAEERPQFDRERFLKAAGVQALIEQRTRRLLTQTLAQPASPLKDKQLRLLLRLTTNGRPQ